MLKLSHISCRVDNLEEAAKKFIEMGFEIEWGAKTINNSNNFFVWLGNGPFLEIFTIKKKYVPGGLGLLLLYGKLPAKKWWYWFKTRNAWCDFALEDYNLKNTFIVHRGKKIIVNIEKTKKELIQQGFKVSNKTLHWSRNNFKNERANFSFFVFHNIRLPFVVSKYEPNQKPLCVNHMNGAYKLGFIRVVASSKDYYEMSKITKDDKKIIIEEGVKTYITEIGIIGLNKELNFCGTVLKPLVESE